MFKTEQVLFVVCHACFIGRTTQLDIVLYICIFERMCVSFTNTAATKALKGYIVYVIIAENSSEL